MKLSYADRDTYYADQAFVKIARRRTAVEGLRQGARRADRSGARLTPCSSPGIRWPSIRRSRTGRSGSPHDAANEISALTPMPMLLAERGHSQGHDAHVGHRQGRQHVRHDVERRMDQRLRSSSAIPGSRMSSPRRAVLARRDPRQPPAAAVAPALHADAQPGAEGRQAVHGPRHAGRRQPGADDPAGVPRRRGVLGRLVPEPAHRLRVAPRPDDALLRIGLRRTGPVSTA